MNGTQVQNHPTRSIPSSGAQPLCESRAGELCREIQPHVMYPTGTRVLAHAFSSSDPTSIIHAIIAHTDAQRFLELQGVVDTSISHTISLSVSTNLYTEPRQVEPPPRAHYVYPQTYGLLHVAKEPGGREVQLVYRLHDLFGSEPSIIIEDRIHPLTRDDVLKIHGALGGGLRLTREQCNAIKSLTESSLECILLASAQALPGQELPHRRLDPHIMRNLIAQLKDVSHVLGEDYAACYQNRDATLENHHQSNWRIRCATQYYNAQVALQKSLLVAQHNYAWLKAKLFPSERHAVDLTAARVRLDYFRKKLPS
jgi:hypothetical protein